ncbi:hypothetical protein PVAP13_9KG039561 [Panicum virgatum]|uniref:Uncharacterized protein n=1 Tax=Panicum virgatum TaxID=38727 RepID=A0A8T0N8G9_PANVG|nr:hypothetical protein PVAP13_9KG039561 [Panicum virgatum]
MPAPARCETRKRRAAPGVNGGGRALLCSALLCCADAEKKKKRKPPRWLLVLTCARHQKETAQKEGAGRWACAADDVAWMAPLSSHHLGRACLASRRPQSPQPQWEKGWLVK